MPSSPERSSSMSVELIERTGLSIVNARVGRDWIEALALTLASNTIERCRPVVPVTSCSTKLATP
eukprot:2240868-Prymnesium_polylepis.1